MISKNILGILVLTAIAAGGCAKNAADSATDDTSASGAAASVVGGALSNSNSSGTVALNSNSRSNSHSNSLMSSSQVLSALIPSAFASTACPTFKTAAGSGCVQSGASLWLTYSDCSFGSSAAMWTGTQLLEKSSGTATCGTFPTPASSGSLIRQMVTAANSTTPGSVTRTNAAGNAVTIDDATANLGNYDNQTISTVANGGYGTQVNFNGAVRSSVTIARHITSTLFDHSITGNLTVTETAGANTRTVNGNLTVYHNLLRVIGTATFTDVVHSDTCCTPISGKIVTAYTAGTVTPRAAGLLVVGKSETLNITGCGTGTLTAADGTSTTVAMNNCF